MTTGKGTGSALAQQLLAGTGKHFSAVGSLTFGNDTFTPPEVETFLQTLVDLRTAVQASKAATMAKVAAEEAQIATLGPRMRAYVAYVKATFGNAPDVLADFGLKPRRASTPLTIEQRATAAERRAATRAARHTMATKQKKSVKGTITTIVVSPASPVSPPIAPSPVANAPSQGTSAGTAPHAS
jgi:hypothetical protein